MRLHRLLALITAFALIVVPSQKTLAHEGQDHDATAKFVVLPASSRAEASSDLFELVAIAGSGEIIIYLDRFATNEPVSDANVVVETPQGSVEAKPASDGTYRLAAPWAAGPGRYDLIATVTQDSDADVLAFTLTIQPTTQSAATSSGFFGSALALGIKDRIRSGDSASLFAVVAASILGGIAGLLLARRRRAAQVIVAAVTLPLFALGASAHEGEDHNAPQNTQSTGTREVAQMLADGSVFIPKGTQRILAIRTIIPSHQFIAEPWSFRAASYLTRMQADSSRPPLVDDSLLRKADFHGSAHP